MSYREYVWGVCNIENPNHSDFKLLQSLLGGFICFDAVQNTRHYYKEYKNSVKERKKREEENEKQKKQIGIGAAVVIGVLGTAFALKNKFTF